MDCESLIEILEDVRHDLGKHLPLPLRLLPADADAEAVRTAAQTALLATRRGPNGATTGAAIWAECEAELVELLGAPLAEAGPEWAALAQAVDTALTWAARLDAPIDRAALTADLAGVAPAVDRVLDTLEPTEGPLPEECM